MANIRLPRSRPDVGISPIPSIAPTQNTPGKALSRGLLRIAGNLKRGGAAREDDQFAEDMKEVSESLTILNDDGSTNYEDTMLIAEQYASDPLAGLTATLGEDGASRIMANPGFSVNSFRQQSAKIRDESAASVSVKFTNESRSMINDEFRYTTGANAELEASFRTAVDVAETIDDPHQRRRALDAISPSATLAKLEKNALSDQARTVQFYSAAIEGQYEFLDASEDYYSDKLTKYITDTADKALSTVTNGYGDPLASPGFYDMDLVTNTVTPTTVMEDMGDLDLTALNPLLNAQLKQVKSSALISSTAVTNLFTTLDDPDIEAVGSFSSNDFNRGLKSYAAIVGKLEGLERRKYIRNVNQRMISSYPGGVPEDYISTLKDMAHNPVTGLDTLAVLVDGFDVPPEDGKTPLLVNHFNTQDRADLRSLRGSVRRMMNSGLPSDQAFMAALEFEKESKENAKLGLVAIDVAGTVTPEPTYEDPNNELMTENIDAVFGEGTILTMTQQIAFNARANAEYWRQKNKDPNQDQELLLKNASRYAAELYRDSGQFAVAGRLQSGPSPLFLSQSGQGRLTPEVMSDLTNGAIMDGLNKVGLKVDEDTFSTYEYEITEVMQRQTEEQKTAGIGPSIVLHVITKSPEGYLVGVNKDNQYATGGSSTPLILVLDIDDFRSYGTASRPNLKVGLPRPSDEFTGAQRVSPYFNSIADAYQDYRSKGVTDDKMTDLLKSDVWRSLRKSATPAWAQQVTNNSKWIGDLFGGVERSTEPLSASRRSNLIVINREEMTAAETQMYAELKALDSPDAVMEWASTAMANPREYFKMTETKKYVDQYYRDLDSNWFFRETRRGSNVYGENRQALPPSEGVPNRSIRWGINPDG